MNEEEIMIQIQNTLVSLDLAEVFFCCDIEQCKGQCCIDGDAGAPITKDEFMKLQSLLPAIKEYLLPAALKVLEKEPVGYTDEEGDLVTNLISGANCVFSCYYKNGICLCAVEKAHQRGLTGDFKKPMSCYLYPLRLTEYPSFIAVNYHRWKICKSAEVNGRVKKIRLYQFMKEPLIKRFGKDWYDELVEACEAYLAHKQ